MHLIWTLCISDDTGDVRTIDVAVDAPAGGVLADVADRVRAAAGRPGADLYAGSAVLPPATALGAPLLPDGAVLGIGRPGPRPRQSAAVLELRIIGGPDAGHVVPLPRGRQVLGREPDLGIGIDDPDISRQHAALTVGLHHVTIEDLGSTNGTWVGDRRLGPGAGETLRPGQRFRIGESTGTVLAPGEAPAAVRRCADGTLAVLRPPRIRPPRQQVEIGWPGEPAEQPRPRLQVVAMVLPIVFGVGMALLLRTPTYLFFTVLSPLMLLGGWLSERRGRRRGRRAGLAIHAAALADVERRQADAVSADADSSRADHPDLSAVRRTALGPGRRIWERRPADPDLLDIRLGAAHLPTRVVVRRGGEVQPQYAADLPAVVSLRDVGVLGLVGPRPPLLALARAAVGQLAVQHSPRDVVLVVLADDGLAADWSWCRWLPHARAGSRLFAGFDHPQREERVAELLRLLDERTAASPAGYAGRDWPGSRVVVIADTAHLPATAARVFRDGPAVGIHAICLRPAVEGLPTGTGCVARIGGEVGTRLSITVADRAPTDDVVVDAAGAQWIDDVARALAPLRDPGEDGGSLPHEARLLDVLGLDDPADGPAGWPAATSSTRAVIGVGAGGPLVLDLAADGPHALVAGTTGSGKSELLQTLVASLALANRPDLMSFVLVDYKGGAAFRDCLDLPHTVGVVTDLDPHLTERALRSLGAELARRERVLAEASAADLTGYDALRVARPSLDPLARLVIVVDEFAALADDLPRFVTGLVAIAQRGRSLGVHLILATQRPGGVVSPEIRANASLRIALRVTDAGESSDVLGVPAAATIPRDLAGRAFVRRGGEPVEAVQIARVAVPGRSSVVTPRVVAAPWSTAAIRAGDATGADRPSDLVRIVRACADAARVGSVPLPRSPWLPPLPELVTFDDLPRVPTDSAGPGPLERMLPGLPLGLLDNPDRQRRDRFDLDLAAGRSLLVVGTARSGRTSLLRSVLHSIATRASPTKVHVHALDCAGGGLDAARHLPHCGTVAGDDPAVGDRLLSLLCAELDRRRRLLAALGHTSLAELHADGSDPQPPAALVLLVDGLEGFRELFEPIDGGRPVEDLIRCVREGPAVGITVVATSDRPGLLSRVAAPFPRRLLLSLPDRGDYSLAGIRPADIPIHLPAGRGVLAETGQECQIALPTANQSGPAQLEALRDAADRCRLTHPAPTPGPLRVGRLPIRVVLTPRELTRQPSHPLRIVLGRGGDDGEWISADLASAGPGLLVAGPPRSGRSTALQTMAGTLAARGVAVVTVASPRSPLYEWSMRTGVTAGSPDDAAAVAEALPAGGAAALLIDDLETVYDTPLAGLVVAILRRAGDRTLVLGSIRSEDLATSFRPPVVELRRLQTGLLLCPGPHDGEPFGLRLPHTAADRTPGRGLLALPGLIRRIQVGLLDGGGQKLTPYAGIGSRWAG